MANFNLNKVILGGRLTADPELKQTPSGVSVISFTVAVNRRFGSKNGEQNETQADFINCVAWRQTAEFISKYFRKGSAICVTGSIQTRSWTDQQGQKRYTTEVVVDEAMFVDSRGENDGGAGYTTDAYGASPSYSSNAGTAPNFEDHNTDDDLPF
jgi:single-strand DNA-binding protein